MIKQTQSFPAAVPFFHLQSCLVSLSYFVNQSSFLSRLVLRARLLMKKASLASQPFPMNSEHIQGLACLTFCLMELWAIMDLIYYCKPAESPLINHFNVLILYLLLYH